MKLFELLCSLTTRKPFYRKGRWTRYATIAQSVEQPPCKRQVGSSILPGGSVTNLRSRQLWQLPTDSVAAAPSASHACAVNVKTVVVSPEFGVHVKSTVGGAFGGGGGGGGGGGAVTWTTWDWVAVRPPESIACTTTVLFPIEE